MHQAMGGRLPGCVHNNNNNVMHHPSLSTIVMLSRAPTNKLHWPCIRPAHHCKVVAPVCRAPPRSYLAATAALTTTQAQAATQINLVTDVLLPTTTITPLAQDLCATLFAAIGAYALVKMFDALAERRVFDQKLSRKLVHLSAGPLFMLSWVLFSPEPYTRYLAALVPCLQALRLIAVGTGWLNSPNTVRAVSRGGDRSELLRGPLYYVLILVAITAIFWRENPIGVVALSLMCGGDGLADIIGRRFGGNNKLPYNESKSLSGSLAMFAGGFAMSMGLISLYTSLGFFECDIPSMAAMVAVVALIATLIESLPINKEVDDNLSVPGVALLVGALLVRSGAV